MTAHAAAGCALKKVSDSSAQLCAVEGFGDAPLKVKQWEEYNSCKRIRSVDGTPSASCQVTLTAVHMATGCSDQCFIENGQGRNVACSSRLNSEYTVTEVPPCPRYNGLPDDYGAKLAACACCLLDPSTPGIPALQELRRLCVCRSVTQSLAAIQR
jgi:hypothetical protein